MTREENVFLAKKLYVELVYNTAYIEGCNVTFPQTQTIIDGGIVGNVAVSDIQTVLNLRDAWSYALQTVDEPLSCGYICKVNEFVSRNESLQWGVFRTGGVGVSGTEYRPPVPVQGDVEKELLRIASIDDPVDRALECFSYSVHMQLFWDGNKRSSTIVATKLLMEENSGVLSIDPAHAQAFNEGLLHLYNTGDSGQLKETLLGCIKTFEQYQTPTAAQ